LDFLNTRKQGPWARFRRWICPNSCLLAVT
jgi:hypothetical protein